MSLPRIFVSYSHRDVKWLKELRLFLAGFQLDVWDDGRMHPGTNWRDTIQRALESADIAVVLVSQNFIASQFIQGVELPSLLARHDTRGTLFWIACEHSHVQGSGLGKLQAAHDPSRPLSDLSVPRRKKVLKEITERICRKAERWDASVRSHPILSIEAPSKVDPGPAQGTGAPAHLTAQSSSAFGPLTQAKVACIVDHVATTNHSAIRTCHGTSGDRRLILKETDLSLCDEPALQRLIACSRRVKPLLLHEPYELEGMPLEIWTENGRLYELQPFIDGVNLGDFVSRSRETLNGTLLVACFDFLASTVTMLERQGLVHRDINPYNMIMKPSGGLTLLDWTFCSTSGEQKFPVATPGFAAPEQKAGRASPATEWFAIASTIYFLAVGRPPPHASAGALNESLHEVSLQASEGQLNALIGDDWFTSTPSILREILLSGRYPRQMYIKPTTLSGLAGSLSEAEVRVHDLNGGHLVLLGEMHFFLPRDVATLVNFQDFVSGESRQRLRTVLGYYN